MVEEPRGTQHRGNIRKGFLSRWCLHWVLNHEWELPVLGGGSRQRDPHRGSKKKRGVRGKRGCRSNMTKGMTGWLESQQGTTWRWRTQVKPQGAETPFPTGLSKAREIDFGGQIWWEAEKTSGEVVDTPDKQRPYLPCAMVGNGDRGSVGWWSYLGNTQESSRLSDQLDAEGEDEGKERIENLYVISMWMTGKRMGRPTWNKTEEGKAGFVGQRYWIAL